MYVPAAFREDRIEVLHALMREHSFATVVSNGESGLVATHLPILLDAGRGPRGTLVGHMARANPHWQSFREDVEILIIFQGPHAYISPSWYTTSLAVPTWNYAAIHAYGSIEPSIIDPYLGKSFFRDPRLTSVEFFEVEATAIVIVDHVNCLLI